MRRRIIAGAGALWLAAVGSATAADIPVAPIVKAPVRVQSSQSWYGFYIGVHGGYGWGRNAVELAPDATYAPLFALAGVPNSVATNPKGFIGGIQYGSNYQFDRLVIGTDSDLSYSDIKASQTINGVVLGLPFQAVAEQKLKWFGTTRVRGGFLATDNLLIYATGGLAEGRVSSSARASSPGCLIPGSCPAGSLEKTKFGWAVGGGVEYADGPWQWRLEYLHYDLGSVNYLITDPALPGAAILGSTKFSGDIVRGGLSYRFNWTPWEMIFGRS